MPNAPRLTNMFSATTLRAHIESSLGERLSSTLLLRERLAPLTVPTGIEQLDTLTGGLPRGALSEIVGRASSGRTGVMMSALACATRRQEVCALVDASDSFDPASAQAAGIALDRLLWIRCSEREVLPSRDFARHSRPQCKALRRLDQVLKVTDLLLQSGGFGMVVLDLGDIPAESARRVPLTSWFRFRRAVEPTATVLLLIEQEACAKTCASLVLELQRRSVCVHNPMAEKPAETAGWRVITSSEAAVPATNPVSHADLLHEMQLQAEAVRSWTRKPVQAAHSFFALSAKYAIR
jgi:recombination protein RecA